MKKPPMTPRFRATRVDLEIPEALSRLKASPPLPLNWSELKPPRNLVAAFNKRVVIWLIWEYSHLIKRKHGSAPPLDNESLNQLHDVELEYLCDMLRDLAYAPDLDNGKGTSGAA
jgi:hypothetical protein